MQHSEQSHPHLLRIQFSMSRSRFVATLIFVFFGTCGVVLLAKFLHWTSWVTVLALLGANFVLLNGAYWYEGWSGLGQWPNPHGRYYDEWMKLPEGAGDYYEWLAAKMNNREPWASWAKLDRKS